MNLSEKIRDNLKEEEIKFVEGKTNGSASQTIDIIKAYNALKHKMGTNPKVEDIVNYLIKISPYKESFKYGDDVNIFRNDIKKVYELYNLPLDEADNNVKESTGLIGFEDFTPEDYGYSEANTHAIELLKSAKEYFETLFSLAESDPYAFQGIENIGALSRVPALIEEAIKKYDEACGEDTLD